MPQEPKKRHSRARQGKRRASIHFDAPVGVVCPNCGAVIMPHAICKNCGYYKGAPVLVLKQKEAQQVDKEKAKEKSA